MMIVGSFLSVFLLVAPPIPKVDRECETSKSVVPEGYAFDTKGPQRGSFVLSLALPASARSGEPIVAAMKLESLDAHPVQLLADERPWGAEYEFQITDVASGEQLVERKDRLRTITTISRELVSRSCPAYQVSTLTTRYVLGAGTYTVRAFRVPTEVTDISVPTTRKLPEVVSNAVILTVMP